MLLWPGTELMTPLSAAFFPTLDRTTAMPFSKYDVTQRKFAECRKLTRWRMRPTSLPAKTCREGPASAMVAPQAFNTECIDSCGILPTRLFLHR